MSYPKIKDFKDFLFKAKAIKEEYGGIESPQFCLEYVVGWRNYIYAKTNISLKNRGYMWEYLNDDCTIQELLVEYYRKK
jgi:hypothetical protein